MYIKTSTYSISDLLPLINWQYFFMVWQFPPRFAAVAKVHDCVACREAWIAGFPQEEQPQAREAARLFAEAMQTLREKEKTLQIQSRVVVLDAWSEDDDIVVSLPDNTGKKKSETLRLPFLRQQVVEVGNPYLCLADFIRPQEKFVSGDTASQLGFFCSTVCETEKDLSLMEQTIFDRLAEAGAEKTHKAADLTAWNTTEKVSSIRPAVGFPSIPDQSFIFLVDRVLRFETLGIRLTENGMMQPHASVCGLLFAHPAARYFKVGLIGEDQLRDYARRRATSPELLRPYLLKNLSDTHK